MVRRLPRVFHQVRLQRRLAEVELAQGAKEAQRRPLPRGSLLGRALAGSGLLAAGVRRVVCERFVEQHVHLSEEMWRSDKQSGVCTNMKSSGGEEKVKEKKTARQSRYYRPMLVLTTTVN